MEDFFLIIVALLASVSLSFSRMDYMECNGIDQMEFSVLRSRNTPMNRFLLYMLASYKRRYIRRSHTTKKERNYFYYSKKIYKYLLLLSIPWFIFIFFMKWYLIENFFRIMLVIVSVIGFLPLNLLIVMEAICDIKIYVINQRVDNKDKKGIKQNDISDRKTPIKKILLIFKILIEIISVPIVFLIVVFLVDIIKVLIQRIT